MLKEFMAQWVPEINKRLEEFFKEKEPMARNYGEINQKAFQFMKEMTLSGGKRIRPVLLIAGYLSQGKEPDEGVFDVATAVELFHNFLLIHDDVIDKDEVRRGLPTLWKRFQEELNLDQHLAFSLAISTGDILYAYVVEKLAKADLPPDQRIKVLERFTHAMELTGYGENLDIYLSVIPIEEVDEKWISVVHELKTGVYTISFPLALGAELAGADEDTLNALYEYGVNAGIAFQLHDDILGVFGDPEKTGKPVGNDIREGKRTLLLLTAYRNADEEGRKILEEAIGSNDEEKIRKAIEVIEKTGARDYVERVKKEFAEEAIARIKGLNLKNGIDRFLEEFAIYLITREK